mmetsp:Transcript_8852/g.20484  ORF Transcript_8852/g.20484 Transcript_8852/m.20484 type:complete len:208 (+) Transcript_8852:689-1312(+)
MRQKDGRLSGLFPIQRDPTGRRGIRGRLLLSQLGHSHCLSGGSRCHPATHAFGNFRACDLQGHHVQWVLCHGHWMRHYDPRPIVLHYDVHTDSIGGCGSIAIGANVYHDTWCKHWDDHYGHSGRSCFRQGGVSPSGSGASVLQHYRCLDLVPNSLYASDPPAYRSAIGCGHPILERFPRLVHLAHVLSDAPWSPGHFVTLRSGFQWF